MLRPSRSKHSNHGGARSSYSNGRDLESEEVTGKNKRSMSTRLLLFGFLCALLVVASLDYRQRSTNAGSQSLRKIKFQALDLKNPEVPVHGVLRQKEDAALEFNAKDQTVYHLVFSTDCSSYQHWQSYLLFYSALKVRQPGHVTRIASGCKREEAKEISDWFNTHIRKMSSRFHLHLTPHFSSVKTEAKDAGKRQTDYKFFNKPFGLRHWLENSPEIGIDVETGKSFREDDDIVILIDPDMVLLRPITGDFSDSRETLVGPMKAKHPPFASMRVEKGKPFAQAYGLGRGWLKFDLDKIAGPDSPAKLVQAPEVGAWYPAGPPYIATVADMYQISRAWTEFAPKVYEQYPHLLAEMYAYCIAAAHLKLPHRLVDSLMVSNVAVGGEAWKFVDELAPVDEMCKVASSLNHEVKPVPSVIHLCQRYSVGDVFFFGKRKVPHNIFSCEFPLLVEPPPNLASLYDFKLPPGQAEPKSLSAKQAGREAFMLCAATSLLNEASTLFKRHSCPDGKANLNKSFRLGRDTTPVT